MMRKEIKKHILFFTLSFSFFALSSLLALALFSNTSNYKLDRLAYDISDYNAEYNKIDSERPYVKITKTDGDTELFNNMFQDFYYGLECGSVRQYVNDSIDFNGIDLRLYAQKTISIQSAKSSEGGYRVDYGIVHAYFSDRELGGNRDYITVRFNCDSAIYISDIFANYLCDYYGLEKNTDSYMKLIKEEKYAVLPVKMNNEKTLKLSINNILYSDLRQGDRLCQFNKYFGIVNYPYLTKYSPQISIELDFKSYSYYIKTVLNRAVAYEHNVENCSFEFYEYNKDTHSYYHDAKLDKQYIDANTVSNNTLLTILTFVFCAIASGIAIFAFDKINMSNFDAALVALASFILLIVFTIVSIANFVYQLATFLPILFFVIICITKGGDLIGAINKKLRLEKSKRPESKEK